MDTIKVTLLSLVVVVSLLSIGHAEYLGCANCSPYDPNSINNPLGRYGSPLSPDSVNNPLGRYGSSISPDSPFNPLATNPPQLYQNGQYKGDWSANPYDPNSVFNPVSPYSQPYSINPYQPLDVWSD